MLWAPPPQKKWCTKFHNIQATQGRWVGGGAPIALGLWNADILLVVTLTCFGRLRADSGLTSAPWSAIKYARCLRLCVSTTTSDSDPDVLKEIWNKRWGLLPKAVTRSTAVKCTTQYPAVWLRLSCDFVSCDPDWLNTPVTCLTYWPLWVGQHPAHLLAHQTGHWRSVQSCPTSASLLPAVNSDVIAAHQQENGTDRSL